MAPRKHRGADSLALALSRAGVRRLFTLSGNHVMPVFDACLDAGIELLHVRHEAAAVHMADAWARLTGEVGVALVTGGPGHANAIGALYTAAMAESPVVLLSGHAPLNQLGLGAFQEMRQADIAAPLCKWSHTSASADRIASDLAQAIRTARRGRPGPVHLSLPNDALDDLTDPQRIPALEAFLPPALALDASRARALMRQLAAAKRPLIVCGPQCMTRGGRARMAALEAASGIPVVGMESPRGIADPSLGAFAEVLAQADAVLLAGKKLDFTLKFGRAPAFPADCTIVSLDADEVAIPAALEALAQAAAKGDESWLQEVNAAIAYRPPGWASITTVKMLQPLQSLLDAHSDSVLVSDGGEIGQWAQACLTAPNRVINGVAGSIGAALPFAVAARLARPQGIVIAVMGDGTFGFHPAELDTAVRYALPFLCVVGNDARWNAEYQIQLRDYGAERLVGCELLPAAYELVAQGFGCFGERLTDSSHMAAAAKRALASGKPAVLNATIEGLPAPIFRR